MPTIKGIELKKDPRTGKIPVPQWLADHVTLNGIQVPFKADVFVSTKYPLMKLWDVDDEEILRVKL